MKIIDNTPKSLYRHSTFLDFPQGQIFTYKNEYYIKIENIHTDGKSSPSKINAIHIDTGCVYYFDPYTRVVTLKTELHVEKEQINV